MAEAFEDGRDLFQPILAGVDFSQEFFQLGDDAALFIAWWKRKRMLRSRICSLSVRVACGWIVARAARAAQVAQVAQAAWAARPTVAQASA